MGEIKRRLLELEHWRANADREGVGAPLKVLAVQLTHVVEAVDRIEASQAAHAASELAARLALEVRVEALEDRRLMGEGVASWKRQALWAAGVIGALTFAGLNVTIALIATGWPH